MKYVGKRPAWRMQNPGVGALANAARPLPPELTQLSLTQPRGMHILPSGQCWHLPLKVAFASWRMPPTPVLGSICPPLWRMPELSLTGLDPSHSSHAYPLDGLSIEQFQPMSAPLAP
jgi:hypothetical protein